MFGRGRHISEDSVTQHTGELRNRRSLAYGAGDSSWIQAMTNRHDDLQRFCAILDRLEEKLEGTRCLADCSGRMDWPCRGVYFFQRGREPFRQGAWPAYRSRRYPRENEHGTSRSCRPSRPAACAWTDDPASAPRRFRAEYGSDRAGGGSASGHRYRAFSRRPSPVMRASFFARVQHLSCRSRSRALVMSGYSSA